MKVTFKGACKLMVRKSILFLLSLLFILSSTCSLAFAATKSTDEDSPYIFLVPAGDQGVGVILPCGADFHYYYAETYTPTSGSIKYTYHKGSCYVNDWQHGLYASVSVGMGPTQYYDKNGNYIDGSYLDLYEGDLIFPPTWHPYLVKDGTDIATVNTNPSTAKLNFTCFCPEALYGTHAPIATLSCS